MCIHALQYTQVIQEPVSPFQHTECEFDKKSEKWKDRHIPDCPAFPLTACHTGNMICVSEHAQTYSHGLCPACLPWSRVPINLKLSSRGPSSVQVTHQPAHRGPRVPAQHACCWCVGSYIHCFFVLTSECVSEECGYAERHD